MREKIYAKEGADDKFVFLHTVGPIKFRVDL